MLNQNLIAYYKLGILLNEVKEKWGIKLSPTVPRFDTLEKSGDYILFEMLKNNRGKLAGSLCFSLSDGENVQNTDAKRTDDKCLTKGGNVTAIQIKEVTTKEIIATGDFQHPLTKQKYPEGALILINPNYTVIEIFVFEEARNLKYEIFQLYNLGDLDFEIENMRKNAKPFFNY